MIQDTINDDVMAGLEKLPESRPANCAAVLTAAVKARSATKNGPSTSKAWIAAVVLGLVVFVGSGLWRQGHVEAVRWSRKAVKEGNAKAQYNLGWMYANGIGVKKDDAEAVRWFRKAAEQGYDWGQYNLGVMYENGRGVAKDLDEAVRWYRKAVEQGHARAKENLERLER